MTPVGLEPTQFALVELEPALDHSGKVSTAGLAKILVQTSGTDFFSFKSAKAAYLRHMAEDTVSERLRSWTRNPIGSAQGLESSRGRTHYAAP